MSRGSEPAFPIQHPGHGVVLGLTIREHVSIELFAALLVAANPSAITIAETAKQAWDAADRWVIEWEKRYGNQQT